MTQLVDDRVAVVAIVHEQPNERMRLLELAQERDLAVPEIATAIANGWTDVVATCLELPGDTLHLAITRAGPALTPNRDVVDSVRMIVWRRLANVRVCHTALWLRAYDIPVDLDYTFSTLDTNSLTSRQINTIVTEYPHRAVDVFRRMGDGSALRVFLASYGTPDHVVACIDLRYVAAITGFALTTEQTHHVESTRDREYITRVRQVCRIDY